MLSCVVWLCITITLLSLWADIEINHICCWLVTRHRCIREQNIFNHLHTTGLMGVAKQMYSRSETHTHDLWHQRHHSYKCYTWKYSSICCCNWRSNFCLITFSFKCLICHLSTECSHCVRNVVYLGQLQATRSSGCYPWSVINSLSHNHAYNTVLVVTIIL